MSKNRPYIIVINLFVIILLNIMIFGCGNRISNTPLPSQIPPSPTPNTEVPETSSANTDNGTIVETPVPTPELSFSMPAQQGTPMIVFTSDRDDGKWQIYSMNIDGSNQTRLTADLNDDIDPSWSPDGSKIAFVSNINQDREIYVASAGGKPKSLTSGWTDSLDPSWSPDSEKISFETYDSSFFQIYVTDLDSNNQTEITSGEI